MNCKKSLLCLVIVLSGLLGYMIHLGMVRHEKYIMDKEYVTDHCIHSKLDVNANIDCEELGKCVAKRAMFLFDPNNEEQWQMLNIECLGQMLED